VAQQAVTAESQAATAPQDASHATPGDADPYADVLDYLRQYGDEQIATKYKNGADALAGLVNAQRLIGQRDEMAQLGRHLAERPHEVFERLRQQFGEPPGPATQVQQAPQPAEQKPAASGEFDPLWLTQVTRDPQTGAYIDLPGASPGVAQKVNRYVESYFENQRKRLQDPLAAPEVQSYLSQNFVSRQELDHLTQTMRQQAAQSEAVSTVQRLAPKLFVGGDHSAGRTHWGNIFVSKLQEASNLGIGRDPATGMVDYSMANGWAEQQADLMHAYFLLAANQQKASRPVSASSAGASKRPAGKSAQTEVPKDASGHRDLSQLLEARIKDALEAGQVSQAEVDKWAMVG
jgi:hypothetical protein